MLGSIPVPREHSSALGNGRQPTVLERKSGDCANPSGIRRTSARGIRGREASRTGLRGASRHFWRLDPAICRPSRRRQHMSPRTLQRRLADEGTTFQKILESLRRNLCLRHLESGARSASGDRLSGRICGREQLQPRGASLDRTDTSSLSTETPLSHRALAGALHDQSVPAESNRATSAKTPPPRRSSGRMWVR